MELKACKRCGGKLRFSDERNVYVCLYCKSEFKPTDNSPEEEIALEKMVSSTEEKLTPNNTENNSAKKGAILIVIGLVVIGLIIFFMRDSDSGSGVNFTANRVQISHHNLSFEIPDTIHPQIADNGVLQLRFSGDDIWLLVSTPRTGRTQGELEAFKDEWFSTRPNQLPFGTSETLIVNGNTAILQEIRYTTREGKDMIAFVYANREIYVFHYRALDRFFDTYYPYFIEILESINWTDAPIPEGDSGTGSGVDFSGDWVPFPHRNLILEIPDTIVPRPIGDANQHVGLPFDAEENAWVAAFRPAQDRTADELGAFKDEWFVNHGTLMPIALAETMTINGQTAFIQEARSDAGGQSTLVFVYADGEIYVFQYHAGDRFFDAYRPYFIKIMESISW